MTTSKQFNFKKTLIVMMITFIIIVTIVEALFSLSSEAGLAGYLHNFTYPTIIKFGIAKLIGALIYGLFMAFILKRKAKKMAGK